MKIVKFGISLIFFVTCIGMNQAYSQSSGNNASEKKCSERTVDHYNDKNIHGEGLEKGASYAREVERAGAAADACREKNQKEKAEKAKASEPKKN